ncbi:MAG TPA: FkbM family methyltransferase [Caldimonas sp.]|jgi:FkbM family methyltransferase|nr:FkbM family methyltransferase [Caldimonas sp.]HEX2542325.1 FkbM family methyltransferase [Caldimonas sp.]
MAGVKAAAKRALRYLNITIPIEVAGRQFRAPLVRGLGFGNRRDAEPWMTDVLRRLLSLSPGTAFLDVGVNIGQTLFKVKSLEPDRPYVGFEPNPFCVQYANDVIRINGFRDCEILPVGLADQAAVCQFFAIDDTDSAGSIVEGLRPGQVIGRKQYVPVFPYETVAHLLPPRIGIVKIDVEGAELEVLRGMDSLLRAQQPWITCEVLHSHTAEQIPSQRERNRTLMDFMDERGYAAYQIVKAGPTAGLRPVEAFSEGVYGPASQAVCDYLLAPRKTARETLAAFDSRVEEASTA